MRQNFVLLIVVLVILVIAAPFVFSKPMSQGNVALNENKLYVRGAEFKIKGVGYQPTPIGQGPGYNFYSQPSIYNRDFSLLRNMNANTIRTWGKIQDGNFLDAAYNNGNKPIYVIMGFWVNCNEDYSNATIRQNYINDFGNYVAAYKNYSAVLMWALGNENNLDYCTTAGLVDDLNSMYNEMAKKAYETEGSSYHPVAIINGDVIYLGDAAKKSDDTFLNYIDIWGMNAYPGSSLTAKINEYSALSSKPLFISEYGTDALDNSTLTEDEEMQADWDIALWREIANSSITLGGTIMEYSDEWWKFNDGNWSVHDNGGYYPSWNPASHPDSYVNEEYWGVMAIKDNGSSPDIMQPRKAYYELQGEFLKDSFVKVNGVNFTINGTPFFFAGANNYYLFYKPLSNVREVFDDALSLNLSVIRTWAFCDGACSDGSSYSFQPSPGVYNENNLRRLDAVVKEASDRNLKLILPLVNNWEQYGGMCQYVKWCNASVVSCNGTSSTHEQFYTSNCTRELYKNYTTYFLNRTNTLTGIKYKNDPTILAWELANEPRARDDTTGARLNNWIGEMSAYIKSIDPYHLVTTGVDGGYVDKGSNPFAWWYKGNEGQDYIANHNWTTIDFATFHYYQNMDTSINATEWIQEHIEDAHNIIKKPVLFEEFNNQTNKEQLLSAWYSLMETYGVNGDTIWLLADQNAAGDDGYFVFCPENATICRIIANHANFMINKSRVPPIDYSYNTTGNEYRFYYKNFHFLTIIGNGTFNIRPHPGVDENGWGSSWYMQPFLPGATLKYTAIQSITATNDNIKVRASGYVSNSTNSTYGRWNISINFSYNPAAKKVSGNGSYKVVLDGVLSSGTGDLNLFKIASNYLDNVPLLTGITGDTGDMRYANVILNSSNFTWNPPAQPSYFPQDKTNNISINALGQLNNVDTAAQGYAAIDPAYKPGMEVVLASQQAGIPMIFGGIYDTNKSQKFWEDNVGITPLILKDYGFTNFGFDVVFNSIALPNDGNDSDFDGYNSTSDCNDNNVTIYPGAIERCSNGVDDDCDGSIDINDSDCPGCGNNITKDTNLTYDILNCAGNGLIIGADGVTLDCKGYTVAGFENSTKEGIKASNKNNTKVKNCYVTNFQDGIYISGSIMNITNNVVHNIKYMGILAFGPNATIIGNNISDSDNNLSQGIIVQAGNNTLVKNNNIFNLSGLGIGIDASYGTIITENNIYDNGPLYPIYSAGIVLDELNSSNTVIYHNNIYNNSPYNFRNLQSLLVNLSYNNEGNYWGHTSYPWFTAGNDSSNLTIIDKYPYNQSYYGVWPAPPTPPLQCGDTITQDTNLTDDLLNCAGDGTIGIKIGADNITLNCNGHNLDAASGGTTYAIYLNNTKRNVKIENCNITDFTYGVYVWNSSSITIENNSFYDNSVIIYSLNYLVNSTITNNKADHDPTSYSNGIKLNGAYNNRIESNTFDNVIGYSIWLQSGDGNNLILDNTINSSDRGMDITTEGNDNIINNSISNCQIGVLLRTNDSIVEGNNMTNLNYTGVLIMSSNINLTLNTITGVFNKSSYAGNGAGVLVFGSADNLLIWHNNIYNNSAYNIGYFNYAGPGNIFLSYNNQGNYWGHTAYPWFTAGNDSSNVTIIDNYPYNQSYYGFWPAPPTPPLQCGDTITQDTNLTDDLVDCTGHGIIIGADGITLDCKGHLIDGDGAGDDGGVYINDFDNIIIRNCSIKEFGNMLKIFNSTGNIIRNVNGTSGGSFGIYNEYVNNTLFDNLNIYSSGVTAVELRYSKNNTVKNSLFKDNAQGGVSLIYGSTNNQIFNNTFISNNGSSVKVFFDSNNTQVYDNYFYNCLAAVNIKNATNVDVINNIINKSSYVGIKLLDTDGINITLNSIFDTYDLEGNPFTSGILMQNQGTVYLYHNNIYNNTYYNIRADAPANLSFNNQGNYWGHTDYPFFRPGIDSNDTSIIDSYPYDQAYYGEWPSPPTAYLINLTKGWNLVSLPLMPKNNSISHTLSSIAGNYSKVFIFNNSKWLMYDPNNLSISNINYISNYTGFWIKMLENDTLVSARTEANISYNLKRGLNLISYPSTTSKPINETFNVNFENILTYENNSWKSYDKNKPSYFNTLVNITPGYGYWVKVNSDANWSFNGTYN